MRLRVITLQLVLLGLALLAVSLLLDRIYIAEREEATLRSADAAMELAQILLTLHGEIRREGDHLYAGETELEGGAVVDEVERLTGFGCSIFLRDRRVATTEREEEGGERVLGVRASSSVRARVLRDGAQFRGVTEVPGGEWVILYRPLRDVDGHVVGMLAAYQDRALWLSGIGTFRLVLGLTLLGLYLLVVFLVRRLGLRAERLLGDAAEVGRRQQKILTDFGVELRTPLVSIMNTGSALRDDALKGEERDPELAVTGEQIESQARQLLGLVNSALDAAKVSPGGIVGVLGEDPSEASPLVQIRMDAGDGAEVSPGDSAEEGDSKTEL